MPVPATVPEFLELVRKGGLVPDKKLDEILNRHRATGAPQTVDHAAAALVREGLLTFFQAKQVKQGRYKRFTIGSKYRLLELIGAGGMGAVYLCEHMLMKRLVALKVLPVEKLEDQSNLERFYREARAVAALDHPNIVRAYDIDQFEKLHFLVMEYVDGTSLQEIVARYAMEKKRFDPIRAAHYIAQAAVGMQHAHELGMVHRDIKPGNVLLDRSGVIKVLDMGLARFFNKQQDSVTEKYDDKCVLGTADYLAPEQAVSNIVDVRADIYSLGGTLYFMLTGQTPFPEGTIAAKLVAHQTREPRAVETFRSDVPPGILAVLRKMMAKEPADRYQEPIHVAEALTEWASQELSPPPENEMPTLCPLVKMLAGPADRANTAPPLARVLFGPGRGVFSRPSGSSNRLNKPRESDSIITESTAAFPLPSSVARAAAKLQPEPKAGSSIKRKEPASTARASAAPTAAHQQPGSSVSKKRVASPTMPANPQSENRNHAWLFVLLGVAVLLLFVTGAVVAYQIGKGNKAAQPTQPDGAQNPPRTDNNPNDPMPGLGDKQLTPAQAREREGEVHTVEFQVKGYTHDANLNLHSELNPKAANNFVVRVSGACFKQEANPNAFAEKTGTGYTGQTIRVRGKILRDPQNQSLFIEVRTLKQIVVVND